MLTVNKIAAEMEQIQLELVGMSTLDGVFTVYLFHPFKDNEAGESITVNKITHHENSTILHISRYKDHKDNLYAKFLVKYNDEECVGKCFVNEFNNISKYSYPYPIADSIKGLQVAMIEDAIELGVKHAALNINMATIMCKDKSDNTITFNCDGEEYYFNKSYMERYDIRVRTLSDNNIIVTLILLDSKKWEEMDVDPEMVSYILHPEYDINDPGRLISAFPVITDIGLRYYKAFVEFLAERYMSEGKMHGSVSGFIISNEVNSHWVWGNAGRKTVDQYELEYIVALRMAYYAAIKTYSNARVYISIDHCWTRAFTDDPELGFGAKFLVDLLSAQCREEGDFPWAIAQHPYSEDLNYSDFWNNKLALDDFDTPKITYKNIEVLGKYMQQAHLLFDNKPRKIILSEQGFNSHETDESERLQAAAYCLAYEKIRRIPAIDAFILHAHVDNRDEFGLNLGIWARDKESEIGNKAGRKKPIYEVFKYIDTDRRDEIIAYAKAIIGEDVWDSMV